MVDVTAKLVWYKLGETYSNLVEKCEKLGDFYRNFSLSRLDILDMFFLAWIGLAFATVAAIHIYLRFFSKRTISFGRAGYVTGLGGESCLWVNSVLKWLYVHLHQTPWLVQQWIEELNKTALQNTLKPGDVQVKFENIIAGSLPPKISNLSTNIEDSESLTVKADVEACDVAFLMTALQQTQSGVISANCELTIQRLTGQIKYQIYIISDMRNESMQLTASFAKVPDIKFIVKQRGFDTQIEPGRIETAVRRAISDAKVFWNIGLNTPNTNMQRPLTLNNQIRESYQNTNAAYKYNSMDMRHEPNMYPLNVAKTAIRDRKLLVKVIKASCVSDIDTGMSDPYCIVSMDEPAQKHSTSACKHTFNPFWDEHFLFDLNDATQQLRFELYDKSKNPGSDFLGRAFVMVDELRSTPGSRQILPLAGKPKGQGGSLTVEFLFVESNDNTAYNDLPRRHIDTTRTVTPGGTLITQTTTTTERPRTGRNPQAPMGFHESPKMIQKTENYYSAESPNRTSALLEAHDAALTDDPAALAIRHLEAKAQNTSNRPKTPTKTSIVITGVKERSPNDAMLNVHDNRDIESLSAYSFDQQSDRGHKKKRSLGSALRKRFNKKGKRSQSADRTREDHMLRPSDSQSAYDAPGAYQMDDDKRLRKSRSSSFSLNLKKLFSRKPKYSPRPSPQPSPLPVQNISHQNMSQPSPNYVQQSNAIQYQTMPQQRQQFS